MKPIIKILKLLYEHGFFVFALFLFLIISIVVLYRYIKNTKLSNSNQSLVVTTHSILCILILLFCIRFWPPYNNKTAELIAQGGGGGGVTLNYGDTDFGKGDDYLNETLEVNMKEIATVAEETVPDEILTQDNVGAAIETPPKTNNKPKDKKPIETKPIETKPIDPKPKETPNTPVRKPNAALSNMIKGNKKGGDGNSNTNGNQGSLNGDSNSNGYYGNGGSGGGTGGGNGTGNGTGSGAGSGSGSGGGNGSGGTGGANYSLAGRRAIIKPDVDNDCNSFGKVVIEVTVDKSGKTIAATNGRGTTGDACLIALAKKFAMRTKWDASDSAADKQVGTITYNFKN